MSPSAIAVESLRERLPLPDLMHRLGLGEHAKREAFCPFHENRNTAAFSVYHTEGRWRWNCFAGCGSGDEFDFLQKLEGLDFQGGKKRWAELAGLASHLGTPRHYITTPKPIAPPSAPKVAELPEDFRKGSEAELRKVADLRKVSFWAVAEMSHRGVLGFGTVCGFRCWIVTDASRRVAEARRMDGLKFPPVGSLGERKAHTLKGSSKAWPVGLALADDRQKDFRRILLLEGSGDFVAGYHFCLRLQSGEAGRFLPVAMLGASAKIAPEALRVFSGKVIWIVPHSDANAAGQEAEERWKAACIGAGLHGNTFSLSGLRCQDGRPVKDLNDCTEIHPQDETELEGLLK